MKLLITGSNGFVAGSIIQQAPSNWELHGIARTDPPSYIGKHIHHQLNLHDEDAVVNLIEKIQPAAIIHTAAIANIDVCQANPSLAEKVNVGITKTIAAACAAFGIKMIFCSTDSVFDGKRGNYSESDFATPINEYADTKIRGEAIVMQASGNNIIARLALVMGLPVIGTGNSFMHDTMLQLSGNTCCSRLEMGKEIARVAGFPEDLVTAAPPAIPGRAPRAKNVCLDNSRAKSILKTPMLSLTEGIYRSLHYKENTVS
jgi:dTDP-4-dehydrorhamnose reductase